MERDQLVIQLEKSQDMLMNFQQELNHSEAELEKHKQEVARLKNEQKKMAQDVEKGIFITLYPTNLVLLFSRFLLN